MIRVGKTVVVWGKSRISTQNCENPEMTAPISYCKLCNTLKITNPFLAIILGGFINARTIFFIKLYFDSTVSRPIIETARIDGAEEFKIFNAIILPILVPALAMFSIFNFISMWNNYIESLVLIPGKYNLQPIRVMIANMRRIGLGAMHLGIAISVIPIIVAFYFFSNISFAGYRWGR